MGSDAGRRARERPRKAERDPRGLRGGRHADAGSALYTADLIGLLLRSEQQLKAFNEVERLHETLRICLTVLQKQL